ncbi:MAG: hypothetical protein HFJ60_00970 [Clostridia bacterium]|nr:hypothetical protein [Clostridia bacterium]
MHKKLKKVNNRNMKNYYRESKKEFKKYIRKNPYCTRNEWDNYAHENCLFSAFTISCHELTDNTLKILEKNNTNEFEFLKELYIIIPNPKIRIFFKKFRKILKLKEKEEIDVKR